MLEPVGRVDGKPERLNENQRIAFQGCIFGWYGFYSGSEKAAEWIAADFRNAEVLFPYLNGDELNSRSDCSSSRWVIDFNEKNQQNAQQYRMPWQHCL